MAQKKEAKEKEGKKKEERYSTTYIKQGQKNLGDYEDCPKMLRNFIRYFTSIEGKSIRSANQYYVDIRLFIRYLIFVQHKYGVYEYNEISIKDFTKEDLAAVTKDDVIEYMFFCSRNQDAATTRNRKLTAIKTFYKYLMNNEGFEFNPAADVKGPRIPQRNPKYLTEEQARALLDAASRRKEAERDYCITTLLLHCGMRVSELCNLNVNSARRLTDDSGYTMTIIGKGNKERTVYLDDACIRSIEDWLRVRSTYKGLADNEQAMFVSERTGTRITSRTVERIIDAELWDIGLGGQGYSVHKLRHTAATLMYEGGADALELKEILGHESVATTEIYTHINSRRMREVTRNNPLND